MGNIIPFPVLLVTLASIVKPNVNFNHFSLNELHDMI